MKSGLRHVYCSNKHAGAGLWPAWACHPAAQRVLLDEAPGLIPISVAPCVRVDEPGTERSKARVVVARDYFTPDGAAIVRFETPPIDSGAFPRPYGQIPQPSPIPPYSASYYWEDGTALPYYNASSPNGCQFPHSKLCTFGIANAKQQRYAVMGYALVGTYAKVTTVCPPPAPPSPPPPCSQISVSGDASAYHLSVFELNGNRLWSITENLQGQAKKHPGHDAELAALEAKYGWLDLAFLHPEKKAEELYKRCSAESSGVNPNVDQTALMTQMAKLAQEGKYEEVVKLQEQLVGADPKGGRGRGVVSTASYEASRFGVHSAMPISVAYRQCPKGVYLPPDMERYVAVSKQVMAILRRFTSVVEPVSIDEAFLDVSGSERAAKEPPTCSSDDGIAPAPWVNDKQSATCRTCPKNLFGSATSPSGKPTKARRDSKRAWLVLAEGNVPARSEKPMPVDPVLSERTMFGLNVTVASLKAFSDHGRALAQLGQGPSVCVTRLHMLDMEYPQLSFEIVACLDAQQAPQSLKIAADRPWKIQYKNAGLALAAPDTTETKVALPLSVPEHLKPKDVTDVPSKPVAPGDLDDAISNR